MAGGHFVVSLKMYTLAYFGLPKCKYQTQYVDRLSVHRLAFFYPEPRDRFKD